MKQEPQDLNATARKKVLFLITKSNWGGAQRYVYDLATNLPKDRLEAIVAFGGTGTAGTPSGDLEEKLKEAAVRTVFVPSLVRNVSILREWEVWRALTHLMRSEQPDVVHLNSSKAAAWGAFVAFMVGVPRVVFTVHGWPFKERRNFIATKVIREISWLTALFSDVVIVVSKEDERIGQKMLGLKEKIHYVPLGITMPEFLSRDEATKILPAPTNDWKRIVTIAELTPNKGIRFAIEAIALLKKQNINASYFIIGEGAEHEALTELTEQLEVTDRVHLLGFVPDAAKYLKAFDIYLLPSIKEGMPYVLLEATTVGLPIISTDVVDPTFLALVSESPPVKAGDKRRLAEALSLALRSGVQRTGNVVAPLASMVEKTIDLYTTAPTISVSSRA